MFAGEAEPALSSLAYVEFLTSASLYQQSPYSSTESVQPFCCDGWSQRVATGDDNIVLIRGTKKLPIERKGNPGTSPSDYFSLTRTPYKALIFAY